MFEEMKRGALTPTFLQYFRNGDYDHSPLLGAMLEIPAMHVDLILSPESSDCQFLYSWVMLMIRIGSHAAPNSSFGNYLRSYEALFTG
jgi:hypothetical protein